MIRLDAKRVSFASPLDEEMFFSWIRSIKAVKRYYGDGIYIVLEVDERRVSEMALRELLALFDRYKISMRQLKQLETPKNRKWFKDRKNYWYKRVFGH